MKTLILKGLLVLGFVLGLSAIACAQDGEKPVYKLRTVEAVKVNTEVLNLRKDMKESKQKETVNQRVRPKTSIREAKYEKLELRKEVQ